MNSGKATRLVGARRAAGGGAAQQHYRRRVELFSAQTKLTVRLTVLALVTGYFLQKTFVDRLLPHGPPVRLDERPTTKAIDAADDRLRFRHGRTRRIYERGASSQASRLRGPETPVVDPATGDLYVMTEDARLLRLSDVRPDGDGAAGPGTTRLAADVADLHSLGSGRPLGGAFTPDGAVLYVSDAVLGLTRIRNPRDPSSKLELLVNSLPVDAADGPSHHEHERLWYVNDVCIGPRTGKVYFTDASDVAPDRIGTKAAARWDTMYAAKFDLIRGKGTGRVLEYDPTTDATRVLATGLKFANGIGVDEDETFLVVAQTFSPRLSKYHLAGDREGSLETILPPEDLTGYPDGVVCAWAGRRQCYAALPTPYIPIIKLINVLPDPLDRVLRVVLMLLPRWLAPKTLQYGGVVELDPRTGSHRYIQDPTGEDIAMITGVTVHDNKLFLGSLKNDYIGVYELED